MTPSRTRPRSLGRDPDQMFLCNLLTPVAGATKAEAEDKMALIDKLPLEIDALSLLAEGLNFDFAAKGMDEPLTTEELQGMQGMLGIRDGVLKRSGKTNPTARDFIAFSGRGQTDERRWSAGRRRSPTRWRRCSSGRGCDGFVVAATLCAGRLRGFRDARRARAAAARPVPQGLCRHDAAREPRPARPAAGAWKAQPRAAAE